MVEYGVESTLDKTREFINRGHNYECSKQTIIRTAEKGIIVGAHMILGLPGETIKEIKHNPKLFRNLHFFQLKLIKLNLSKNKKRLNQIKKNPNLFHFSQPMHI